MIKKLLSMTALFCAVSVAAIAQPSRIEEATTLVVPEVEEEVVVVEVPEPEPEITCKDCTPVEEQALEFFHDKGITDKYALAMIMGSIKQESRFKPNVCEGGFITTWSGCRRGGYGLIQFTSAHRYYGLGRYAQRTGQPPEAAQTQLEYIVTEREWEAAKKIFAKQGLPMHSYDRAGKIWLGYGIKGKRLMYAWDYAARIS